MIFSGHIKSFKCKDCGQKYTDTQLRSIIPILATIILGGQQWFMAISTHIENKMIVIILSIGLAVLFPYLVFLVFKLPRKRLGTNCRKCGGKLFVTYAGSYYGLIPRSLEVLIYVISIATPFVIRKMI